MSALHVWPSTLSGDVHAPPSKSQTLRAILFGALAKGTSTVSHFLDSPDTYAMIEACKKLGATFHIQRKKLVIQGVACKPKPVMGDVDVGNSGLVLRLFGAVAAVSSGEFTLTGDASIQQRRPIMPLVLALKALGAFCEASSGYAPVKIKGGIHSGYVVMQGSDSQPISGMLIAALLLSGKTMIDVVNPGETPWIDVTLDWFDRLGLAYKNVDYKHYEIDGGQLFEAFEYTVPGDFSSIAYPIVASLITQSTITVRGLDFYDIQGDKRLIDVLCQMGATIERSSTSIKVVKGSTLKGCTIDVNSMIDAVTILAVVGCYACGTTRLINASIAREKESDRLSSIAHELGKMGARITVLPDGLEIEGGQPLKGAVCDSHSDHRVAMSVVVAALGAKGRTTVLDVECMNKSFPGFVETMKALGSRVEQNG